MPRGANGNVWRHCEAEPCCAGTSSAGDAFVSPFASSTRTYRRREPDLPEKRNRDRLSELLRPQHLHLRQVADHGVVGVIVILQVVGDAFGSPPEGA